CQETHAARVGEAAAVEYDGFDAGRLRALCNKRSDALGALRLRRLCRVTERALDIRGGDERASREVVDDLRIDVSVRAEHREPRALRRTADLLAKARMPTQARRVSRLLRHTALLLLPRLAGLQPDHFTLVTDALAAVRLGRAHSTHQRRLLPHDLLVDPGHMQPGRGLE